MSEENKKQAEEIVEKVKDLVKKGNVSRVRILKDDNVIVNLPLTAGVVGSVVVLAAAPWAMLLAAVTTIGLDCRVEVEKTDGEVIAIQGKDVTEKAVKVGDRMMDMGEALVDEIRKKKDWEAESAGLSGPERKKRQKAENSVFCRFLCCSEVQTFPDRLSFAKAER